MMSYNSHPFLSHRCMYTRFIREHGKGNTCIVVGCKKNSRRSSFDCYKTTKDLSPRKSMAIS